MREILFSFVWNTQTRCRELIDILSDLNISTDYDKLLNIKSQLADTVLTEINNNDGVFIPRSISKDLPNYFAIDNTDLKIDTLDGRNQLHGTAIAVYQKKKKLQKFYNMYLLTSKVNQKNSPSRFIVSSIAQNQSARSKLSYLHKPSF